MIAIDASSSTEKGDDPPMRRESVVRGTPVDSEADRSVMPSALKREPMTSASAREMDSGCSMWTTVVPTWNRHKGPRGEILFRFWYLAGLDRYLSFVDNSRERSPWSQAVAEQIRAERAVADLTQEQLAERAGIARSTYIRLETGKRVADATQLARICGALGIPQSVFWQRVEARHPELLDGGQE